MRDISSKISSLTMKRNIETFDSINPIVGPPKKHTKTNNEN